MIYDGIITKPPIEEVLEHFGVKGMEWSKHKYLNKMNGAYSYGNNPSNDQKMMFEKRKKLFEMKYKNTSAPKKEGSGKISENRSKQKTSDTDKEDRKSVV